MNTQETGLIDSLSTGRLQWYPELGLGYFPVQAQPYDAGYWQRYRELDKTECGDVLTRLRKGFVERHYSGTLIDIGIGGGKFVSERENTYGFDINPLAVEWLEIQGAYWDPYKLPCDAASFWDSLEHIHRPDLLLQNVRKWAFVSVPIFESCEAVMASKHFRKDEHCWYFTPSGLIGFMGKLGFDMKSASTMEQAAGREGIATYAFRRYT